MLGSCFPFFHAAVFLVVVAAGAGCSSAHAQTNEWVWINGTETYSAPVYGTLGSAAPANLPGSRLSASSWADNKGNLWMFGGQGFDASGRYGYLNELWEYSPATNEWAWMGGSNTANGLSTPGVYGTLGTPAPANAPPGREAAATWTDANGNLWLFGGDAFATGEFNDVWEFNPSTNEWAWMGGSDTANQQGVYGSLGTPAVGNVPGARTNAVNWTDRQGNLWLFGGTTTNPNGGCEVYFNDLWRFNPSTKQWAWMGGRNGFSVCPSPGQPGNYGELGVAAATNSPGPRAEALGWVGGDGNFWLFGGYGLDSSGQIGVLNDLWRFEPSTGLWTWMGGGSTFPSNCVGQNPGCDFPPVYGTLQVAAAENHPGSRNSAVSWADRQGNLWLFGGWGVDSNQKFGLLDDLWEYSISTGQWSWMSGSSTLDCVYIFCGEVGVYGALQSPALGNTPSGRQFATSWTDSRGDFGSTEGVASM